MKSRLLLPCILAALAAAPMVRGQSITPSVINNTGGSGTIGSNTYEWSVGEIMVNTFTASTVIVTEGLLQPNLSSTGIATTPAITGISVFPNPSSSVVNIQLDAKSEGSLTYRLMDVAGRLITENTCEIKAGNVIRQLDIKNLASANYMLQVFYKAQGAEEQASTFKIQKLN